MEQRIGSSSQPLEGAGFDPAFIPGLTSPVSGEDARPGKAADTAAEPEESEEQEPAAPEAAESAPSAGGPASEGEEQAPEAAEPAPSEEEADPDGPVFDASDFRARIVADHRGVRLRLDDEECEFRWDEIAAVETESPRFGKRFTVTVHTPDRRWYPIEILAGTKSQHKDWDEALDKVLDAYFEEDAGEDRDGNSPENTAEDTDGNTDDD